MKLFDWKKKGVDPQDAYRRAAATLYMAATTETVGASFPDLDKKTVDTLNKLLFFTRTAILIGWLKKAELSSKDARYSMLLHEFEIIIFPEDPVEGVEIVNFIRKLNVLVVRSQALGGPSQPSTQEFAIEMRVWWQDWLGLALAPAAMESFGDVKKIHLTLQVIDETQFLGNTLIDIVKQLGDE